MTNVTSAQVGTATAGLSAGAVGTYVMALYTPIGVIGFGNLVAGNNIQPCNATGSSFGSAFGSGTTWCCMGQADTTLSWSTANGVTLWLRVS